MPSTSVIQITCKLHSSLSTSLSKHYKLEENLHSSPRLSSSFVPSSRKKSLRPQQDDMTGGDGDVSPPAPPHARMLISGFSAEPGSASIGDVGRSMKRGIEPALAGGSSIATLGSSLPPSKSLKGRGVGAEGGLKKGKKTEPDAPGNYTCCGKSFKSERAVYGHMRIHKGKKRSETKGLGSTVAEGGVSSSVAEAQKKKIPLKLDLNKVPEDDDEEGASSTFFGKKVL